MKYMAVLITLLGNLLFLGVAHAEETTVELSYSGQALIYKGPLTARANRQLFTLYGKLTSKPDVLVISSSGGHFEDGLALGEWVFAHGLRVHVPAFCNSSCANYVFPAARSRELGYHAILLFHGGMMDSGPEQVRQKVARLPAAQQAAAAEKYRRYLQDGQRREALFFRKIGVDQQLTSYGSQPRYRAARRLYPAWSYSLAMLAYFGVRDVQITGNENWFPLADSLGQILILSPHEFACIPPHRVVETLVDCEQIS